MGHPRAKLTLAGRRLLVERIEQEGWSAAVAAEAVGVARATAYKWVRRFRGEGIAGLVDRSCRPRRSPRALTPDQVRQIVRLRHALKHGPHRLAAVAGHPRSTIYAVLRRQGCARLRDFDRPSGRPVRYVRDRPGELLHLDVKKLGRIPPGGGHRVLGRDHAPHSHRAGLGYDFLHVAVDDATRVAFVQALPDERGSTCAGFLRAAGEFFARQGVGIERVLTDRALAYTRSPAFRQVLAELGAEHKLTRPYRPQTNGKAERFIRTLLDEWAYARLYSSNHHRLRRLPRWLRFYNLGRPHTALAGQSPSVALVNKVRGNYS